MGEGTHEMMAGILRIPVHPGGGGRNRCLHLRKGGLGVLVGGHLDDVGDAEFAGYFVNGLARLEGLNRIQIWPERRHRSRVLVLEDS